MNKISISRDGRELGQYVPEEIRGLVMTGELVATDSVLHAPTGEWKPLASISEFAPLFGAEPALPAESGGSAAVAGNAPHPPDLPRSPPPFRLSPYRGQTDRPLRSRGSSRKSSGGKLRK